MSYYYDVILKVPRIEKELVEKVQEYAVENFGWGFKESGLYRRDLIGSFKTFFEDEFILFLKSLDWKLDDQVELLWRGEDNYYFDVWRLNDIYKEREWQKINHPTFIPTGWIEVEKTINSAEPKIYTTKIKDVIKFRDKLLSDYIECEKQFYRPEVVVLSQENFHVVEAYYRGYEGYSFEEFLRRYELKLVVNPLIEGWGMY